MVLSEGSYMPISVDLVKRAENEISKHCLRQTISKCIANQMANAQLLLHDTQVKSNEWNSWTKTKTFPLITFSFQKKRIYLILMWFCNLFQLFWNDKMRLMTRGFDLSEQGPAWVRAVKMWLVLNVILSYSILDLPFSPFGMFLEIDTI